MHFALPPRKTSFPPPYARASAQRISAQRLKQIQYLAYAFLGFLTIYLLFNVLGEKDQPTQNGAVSPDASVLVVTVLDEAIMSDEYISMIKKNREDYAARHGYRTFYTNVSKYTHLLDPAPPSWSLIPALRHALTEHPDIDYIWSLTPHALISNSTLSLHDHIFSRLPDLMRKDIPVVPPDSVIHTFSHLKPSQVYLILTQDIDNVALSSFILRNSQTVPVAFGQPKDTWSQYFLDAWFDPLYRAYAFQKAENHALEHLIQWHPTLLAKLVVIEQRLLNSYSLQSQEKETASLVPASQRSGTWQAGDLVVTFKDCDKVETRDCMAEMKQYFGALQGSSADGIMA